METARLSVVIPSHDTRDLTLRCLGAIEKAMAAGVEVVLVDDGSRDHTAEAVRDRFPAVRVLRHDVAQGFTASQDLDFCLRAKDAGWHVRLVGEARVVHVGGATIGRRSGAARSGLHPGLLWTDLLLWAEKRHGRRWALAAARWLARGGRLRLVARAVVRPQLPPGQRVEWDRDTEAFRQALAELRRWRAEAHSPGRPG